jgi:hypothetical protein
LEEKICWYQRIEKKDMRELLPLAWLKLKCTKITWASGQKSSSPSFSMALLADLYNQKLSSSSSFDQTSPLVRPDGLSAAEEEHIMKLFREELENFNSKVLHVMQTEGNGASIIKELVSLHMEYTPLTSLWRID